MEKERFSFPREQSGLSFSGNITYAEDCGVDIPLRLPSHTPHKMICKWKDLRCMTSQRKNAFHAFLIIKI